MNVESIISFHSSARYLWFPLVLYMLQHTGLTYLNYIMYYLTKFYMDSLLLSSDMSALNKAQQCSDLHRKATLTLRLIHVSSIMHFP